MIELTFLGTGCMMPTKERNTQSIYLRYNGEGFLFDCGEGTQRQMAIAGISRAAVDKIFISHWHGDHVSGLIGLIQTMGNSADDKKIYIYGPVGSKKIMHHLMQSCIFESKIEIEIIELDPRNVELIYEGDDYYIECAKMDHSVPCIAYSFVENDRLRIRIDDVKNKGIPEGPLLKKLQKGEDIEYNKQTFKNEDLTYLVKGKKITIIMDTTYCQNAIELSNNSDILIIESVYGPEMIERAEEVKHMCSNQSALIASNANIKELILTHFSQRYKDLSELEKGAKDIFPNTRLAFDFMKIKI